MADPTPPPTVTPPLVNQPPQSKFGTIKMNTVTLVTLVTNMIMQGLSQAGWTDWLGDTMILSQAIFLVLSLGAGWVTAWLSRDRGNQPAEVKALETVVTQAGLPLPPKPVGNTP